MSTDKLPVKTFRLRRRKAVGLVLFIVVQLALMGFFAHLGYLLIKSPGRIVCAIIVLFTFMLFIFGIMAFVRMVKEGFIGFFISPDGLNDISTGHDYGVVMWRDVEGIRIVSDIEHPRWQYIVLKVKNPQAYIDREPLAAKKRSMILKLHYYGSPICFSNRGLNCGFDELKDTVQQYFDAYSKQK